MATAVVVSGMAEGEATGCEDVSDAMEWLIGLCGWLIELSADPCPRLLLDFAFALPFFVIVETELNSSRYMNGCV